jgi:hypothetical protein
MRLTTFNLLPNYSPLPTVKPVVDIPSTLDVNTHYIHTCSKRNVNTCVKLIPITQALVATPATTKVKSPQLSSSSSSGEQGAKSRTTARTKRHIADQDAALEPSQLTEAERKHLDSHQADLGNPVHLHEMLGHHGWSTLERTAFTGDVSHALIITVVTMHGPFHLHTLTFITMPSRQHQHFIFILCCRSSLPRCVVYLNALHRLRLRCTRMKLVHMRRSLTDSLTSALIHSFTHPIRISVTSRIFY